MVIVNALVDSWARCLSRYTEFMRLGIDFGTTRIVVAASDRGNYPLVSFEGADGATPDRFPLFVTVCGTERRYGWEA